MSTEPIKAQYTMLRLLEEVRKAGEEARRKIQEEEQAYLMAYEYDDGLQEDEP